MFLLVVLQLLVTGLLVLSGVRRGRGYPDDIHSGVITTQVGAAVMIALGETALALVVIGTTTTPPPQAPRGSVDVGAILFLFIFGYLFLLAGLALVWRGWAEILTLALRHRKWPGVVVLGIAVLPLVVTIAYADYVGAVFGFVVPFVGATEIIQDATIRSIPTYLALDPWVVGVLALLTPLAVIAYGTWWLRRIDAAVLAARRAH